MKIIYKHLLSCMFTLTGFDKPSCSHMEFPWPYNFISEREILVHASLRLNINKSGATTNHYLAGSSRLCYRSSVPTREIVAVHAQ